MQKIVPLSGYAGSAKKQKRVYAFVKRSFEVPDDKEHSSQSNPQKC